MWRLYWRQRVIEAMKGKERLWKMMKKEDKGGKREGALTNAFKSGVGGQYNW